MSWEAKASELFKKWVWLNSFLMHMAREVSEVPFDQWLHAHWWVILDAMRNGMLLLEDAWAEPNVEQIALAEAFPEMVQQDEYGCFNVKDICNSMAAVQDGRTRRDTSH